MDYNVNLGKEPEFCMHIGFEEIEDIKLSIAHRQLSNRGSGLLRHPLHWNDPGEVIGVRVIDGIELRGVYKGNKRDARIYHDKIEEHIESLGLSENKFVMISNGNLGNNPWHVAWEFDKSRQLYCLDKEPFEMRTYSCFVVPRDFSKGKPFIKKVNIQEYPDVHEPLEPPYPDGVFDEKHNDLSGDLAWCTFGQQIVREGRVVPIEEIIEEFYDVKHVFDLRDYGERKQKDTEIMKEIYKRYPEKFRENMLGKLKEGFPRAKYYHSTLGLDEKGLVLFHSYGLIEEIAEKLAGKGVRDSIILDQGGSVGIYASWVYPKGGFLSTSSYFRPERISNIVVVLK